MGKAFSFYERQMQGANINKLFLQKKNKIVELSTFWDYF